MDRREPRGGAPQQECPDEPAHALAKTMRIRLGLKPGQRGTKKLLAEYGDRLVCVRYRYDERSGKRIKTVELIVEQSDWEPRARPVPGPSSSSQPLRGDGVVALRVGWQEVELRQPVKAAGGRWNRAKRVWELCRDRVADLGLEARIVKPGVM